MNRRRRVRTNSCLVLFVSTTRWLPQSQSFRSALHPIRPFCNDIQCRSTAPSCRIVPIGATASRSASTALSVTLPLIPATDQWGNWAVFTGTAAASPWLGRNTAVGKLLGAPVTAMASVFLLATVGVLAPGGSEAARSLQILSLQLATPLILLGADLRNATARCGPLLLSFLTAATATVLACIVGWKLTGTALTKALGRDGLVIAAALMAKNVGGGINYVAVCRSLGASPTAVAAGLCVDNIFALVYFPVTSALALGRPDVEATRAQRDENQNEWTDNSIIRPRETNLTDASISLESTSTVLFLAAALLWFGERIGGPAGTLPTCTLLTVALASNAPRSWMAPLQPAAHVAGTLGLYLFFATAGAPGIAVAESVKASLLPLTAFLGLLYTIHGSLLTILGKWGGQRLAFLAPQRLLVASSAAIGGPATAVALAQGSGWTTLQVPSVLVGNVGYAIATFAGLGYFQLFR